jgi:hypothetical protein
LLIFSIGEFWLKKALATLLRSAKGSGGKLYLSLLFGNNSIPLGNFMKRGSLVICDKKPPKGSCPFKGSLETVLKKSETGFN